MARARSPPPRQRDGRGRPATTSVPPRRSSAGFAQPDRTREDPFAKVWEPVVVFSFVRGPREDGRHLRTGAAVLTENPAASRRVPRVLARAAGASGHVPRVLARTQAPLNTCRGFSREPPAPLHTCRGFSREPRRFRARAAGSREDLARRPVETCAPQRSREAQAGFTETTRRVGGRGLGLVLAGRGLGGRGGRALPRPPLAPAARGSRSPGAHVPFATLTPCGRRVPHVPLSHEGRWA
mgnify:CR=1 FL=1